MAGDSLKWLQTGWKQGENVCNWIQIAGNGSTWLERLKMA